MLSTLISIVVLVSSVTIIVAVSLQEGKEKGNATFVPAEPIWGPNQGRGREFTLKRITVVAAVVFMISTLALVVVK